MKKIIPLTLILIVAFVLRFYHLGKVPNGLQQDESSIGYNAYSVYRTQRDEHGAYLPQNFKAFGEYKLPGYIYASILPIALFGLNPFAIRFISATSGFLSVFIVFFLTKTIVQLFINENEKASQKEDLYRLIPYIVASLFAINPWNLQFSRAAFEVMPANFLLLCGVWFFINGVNKTKLVFILISILFLSGSIYTYNIARLFTPIFSLILIFFFWKKIKTFPRQILIVSLVFCLICLLPFLIGIINHGGTDSTFGTLIFSSAKVQAQLQEFRSYFINFPMPITKLVFNYFTLTIWQYVNNIFSHLSANFYFINGSDGITSIGTTGYFYIFELPFVIWGIVWLWKTKSVGAKVIFAWLISLILISSLTREPPQATRTFFLVFPITLVSAIGIFRFIIKVKSFPNRQVRYATFIFSFLIISYYIFIYFAAYYARFSLYYAKNWRIGDREVSFYISSHQGEYNKIIIDQNSGFVYSSLLTYLAYPPEKFQKEAVWTHEDSEGFTHPIKFGKYEFKDINWSKDINSKKTLIVTTADKKPLELTALKTIYYPSRPVVISLGQQIFRYPVSDTAYILVGSKK